MQKSTNNDSNINHTVNINHNEVKSECRPSYRGLEEAVVRWALDRSGFSSRGQEGPQEEEKECLADRDVAPRRKFLQGVAKAKAMARRVLEDDAAEQERSNATEGAGEPQSQPSHRRRWRELESTGLCRGTLARRLARALSSRFQIGRAFAKSIYGLEFRV